MNKEELLRLRKERKKKKPKFRGQDTLLVRIKHKWRQPKGQQSKLRKKRRGHMKHPSPGFSSPKEVRGLDKSGLMPVLVYNSQGLDNINVKEEGIVIGGTVGMKKRIDIIKKASEKKIRILNLKDPEKYLEGVKKTIEGRKKNRAEIRLRHARKGKKKEEPALLKTQETKEVSGSKKGESQPKEERKEETKKGKKSEKIKMLERKQ